MGQSRIPRRLSAVVRHGRGAVVVLLVLWWLAGCITWMRSASPPKFSSLYFASLLENCEGPLDGGGVLIFPGAAKRGFVLPSLRGDWVWQRKVLQFEIADPMGVAGVRVKMFRGGHSQWQIAGVMADILPKFSLQQNKVTVDGEGQIFYKDLSLGLYDFEVACLLSFRFPRTWKGAAMEGHREKTSRGERLRFRDDGRTITWSYNQLSQEGLLVISRRPYWLLRKVWTSMRFSVSGGHQAAAKTAVKTHARTPSPPPWDHLFVRASHVGAVLQWIAQN